VEALIQEYDMIAVTDLMFVQEIRRETVVNTVEVQETEPSLWFILHKVLVGEASDLLFSLFYLFRFVQITAWNSALIISFLLVLFCFLNHFGHFKNFTSILRDFVLVAMLLVYFFVPRRKFSQFFK